MKNSYALLRAGLIVACFSLLSSAAILQRQGNRIYWEGQDAGRFIGVNYLLYLEGRNQGENLIDLDNIRATGANWVRLVILAGEGRDYSDLIPRTPRVLL